MFDYEAVDDRAFSPLKETAQCSRVQPIADQTQPRRWMIHEFARRHPLGADHAGDGRQEPRKLLPIAPGEMGRAPLTGEIVADQLQFAENVAEQRDDLGPRGERLVSRRV